MQTSFFPNQTVEMKQKKALPLLTAGVTAGFLIGLVFVSGQIKDAISQIKEHQYIQYRMFRLVALSFQDLLLKWLIITVCVALALFMIWLLWDLFILRLVGVHNQSRIKRKFLLMKRKSVFRMMNPIKAIMLVLVFFIVVINLGVFIDNEIVSPDKPNVILIVCETFRPDHMGYHGYTRDTTDNIDLLASHSYVFKNAYTQAPCTKPSMWNIVTSKYQSAIPARDDYVTIAEHFRSKNYRTAAFISQQFLGEKISNLQHGFDLYDVKYEKDDHGLAVRDARSITDAAIDWIEKNRKHPFFTWLVYFDPHDPYVPPEGFRGYYNKNDKFSGDRRADNIHMIDNLIPEEHRQFLINAYDEEIRYLDHELGRLLDYLKNSGRYHDSIIILTADHGEELGDNGNRWDHCQLLSQEEIWVPLLIKMPAQNEERRIEEAVQIIDAYPTLVDYFSGRHLPGYYQTLEGKSLLPLIEGEPSMDHPAAISFWQGQRCIVKGNHKYWFWKGKESLIDIKTREELDDGDLLNSLRRQLDEAYNRVILKKEYYEETIEKLKSLGYIKK